MDLVYSVASFGLAAVLSVLVVLGVRRPVEPVWASEGLVANVWCVAITGLIAFGTCFGVRFAVSMNEQPVGLREMTLVGALLTAYYLVLRLMAPRRRLAQYAAERAGWEAGDRAGSRTEVVEMTPPEPDHGPPADPNLPRAA